ncbi:MAG: primosomal protein N' [bacterium]
MSVLTSPAPRLREPNVAGAIADVALPVPVRSTFAYRIPEAMRPRLRTGCRVLVPFGSRLQLGFVVGFDPPDAPAELKSIHTQVDLRPLADDELLTLTRWLADRTLCSWGEALKASLPGFSAPKREKVLSLGKSATADLFGAMAQASVADRIVDVVGESGELSLSSLARALGVRTTELKDELQRLVRSKRLRLAERVSEPAPAGPPRWKVVRLAEGADADELESLARRAPVQARCVEHLREAGGEMPLRDLAEAVAGARPAVKRLAERGLAAVTMEEWEGRGGEHVVRVARPTPNPDQAAAIERITAALRGGANTSFLLHGVTGSGKTEVYLRAMEEARRLGKQSIILVPEITLTPQTVARLRGRFGGRAAVLHSRLSDSERRRTWWAARQGRFDVVLGPRSAIFTPLPALGLVVIDEEHDGAYKQEDAPRYHARDVALERARRCGAVVVLGTATPDVETYTSAEAGEHELLRLPARVSSLPLPGVRLVDVRSERGLFSPELVAAIRERVGRKEQVILFLNRRGFSPFVQCVGCGEPIRCGQCAVSLTWHKPENALRCHYCDHEEPMPGACPSCGGKLFQRGAGTQRVEEELATAIPGARIARLDSDSVRRVGAHEEILGRFLEGEIDILLGTQMVAKGLDFPRVTLVGVINADTGLHLPDWRATERTFQLLAQVSGRAGRSELGGEVLVQTRCPEHACLKAAAAHDDAAFREEEIPQRRELRYPPFARLAAILVRGPSLPRVERAAEEIARRIEAYESEARGWLRVLGPAEAAIARLRGKHRVRILVKGEHRDDVRRAAARAIEPPGFPGVEVIVDVDPMDML